MSEAKITLRKVGVAGTFDRLHKGHRLLLSVACSIAKHVVVGVTSDEFVKGKILAEKIAPFDERKRAVEEFLRSIGAPSFEIIRLDDPFGPAVEDEEMEGLVVTRETLQTAIEINEIRVKRGLKPLKLIVVPLVLAEDGKPISSTRIRLGEIDENGKILKNNARYGST